MIDGYEQTILTLHKVRTQMPAVAQNLEHRPDLHWRAINLMNDLDELLERIIEPDPEHAMHTYFQDLDLESERQAELRRESMRAVEYAEDHARIVKEVDE